MAVQTKKPFQIKIDENFSHLRKILSVDTLLEEINQEEALEFLDAVEAQYWDMKEALAAADKEVKELGDQVDKKRDEIEELEEKVEELEERPEMFDSIKTTDSISWSAGNLQDQDVMHALEAAYEKLTPYQIVERLKVA